MNKISFAMKVVLTSVAVLMFSVVGHAQTRTWVEGENGDDSFPCSRTAPCKTFAGAISKTSEGGEIDAITPGSYGTLSINKAITIDGGTGSGWASILASGATAGIEINVTSGTHVDDANVTVRNLSINGAKQAGNGGNNGITITKAATVHIENVTIQNFTARGVNIDAADTVLVWLQNVTLTKDDTAIRSTTSAGTIGLFLNHVDVQGNTNGLNAQALTVATIRDSFFGGMTSTTVGAVKSGSGCTVSIENSMFASNVIAANAASGGTLRISNNCFYNNSTALTGTGTIATATNTNKFAGNGSDGTPNATITLQ